MLCCLTGAMIAGNALAAGGVAARVRRLRLAMLVAIGAIGLAVGPAVAEHVGHYAEKAQANGRSVLEQILAAPLCTGREERR